MTGAEKQIQGIQSVEIGGQILFALSDAMRPLGLVEISQAVAMPPSKVRRYLVSLARIGLVVQNERSGVYDLGGRALDLGMSLLARTDLIEAATRPMEALRDQIDESVVLVIWSNTGPTVVNVKDKVTPIAVQVRLGYTLPVLHSAAGLIFAAYLPKERTRKFIEKELRSARAKGSTAAIKSMKELDLELSKIRESGYAGLVDPTVVSTWAYGAPIYNALGRVTASLAMLSVGLDIRGDEERTVRPLMATAAEISQALGYSEKRSALLSPSDS